VALLPFMLASETSNQGQSLHIYRWCSIPVPTQDQSLKEPGNLSSHSVPGIMLLPAGGCVAIQGLPMNAVQPYLKVHLAGTEEEPLQYK